MFSRRKNLLLQCFKLIFLTLCLTLLISTSSYAPVIELPVELPLLTLTEKIGLSNINLELTEWFSNISKFGIESNLTKQLFKNKYDDALRLGQSSMSYLDKYHSLGIPNSYDHSFYNKKNDLMRFLGIDPLNCPECRKIEALRAKLRNKESLSEEDCDLMTLLYKTLGHWMVHKVLYEAYIYMEKNDKKIDEASMNEILLFAEIGQDRAMEKIRLLKGKFLIPNDPGCERTATIAAIVIDAVSEVNFKEIQDILTNPQYDVIFLDPSIF
jgi:hypothetical protein